MKEYPINTWITEEGGRRVYLMSAYLHDEHIEFLYIYDGSLCQAENDDLLIGPHKTNRDMIKHYSKDSDRASIYTFEYEINDLQDVQSSGAAVYKLPKLYEEEENIDTEYEYLCDLVKDDLPEELKEAELVFWKTQVSLAATVEGIRNIAIYPQTYETKKYIIDKSVTIPYGECDIKIPYTADGEQSYIILRELKVLDMADEFDKHYDELKKARENTLKEWEAQGKPENQTVIELDEARQFYDKKILTLTFLKPDEARSFEFYETEHLNTEIFNSSKGHSTGCIFISSDKEEVADGLYKDTAVICEVAGAPKLEYEITLMRALESIEHEKKAILRKDY